MHRMLENVTVDHCVQDTVQEVLKIKYFAWWYH